MTTRRRFLQSAASLPPLLACGAAYASAPASRLALVIGNNDYVSAPLLNPVNDAQAMSRLLGEAGFMVSSHLNATRQDMLAAIERFARAVAQPETKQVVFYFAGHGAQLDWRNYLLPIDARVEHAAQVRANCIDLNQIIGELGKSKGKTFIVVLDACRNNPFGSGYVPEHKGLSQFDAPVGSLLAYATSPGQVASDGSGQNGLYTEHLVRELSVRGVRIEDALKRVRLNVRLASQGAQIPWETTSLEQDVFIFDAGKTRLSEAEQEQLLQEDLAAWGRIKNSDRAEDYIQYLRRFPDGRFAEIVQARLARLLAQQERPRPVAAATPAATPSAPLPASPTIHLGVGLPVPLFMAPSDNPYSAGRYALGRHFTVGDSATFRIVDTLTEVVKDTRTSTVTRVDTATDRVEFNHGRFVTDLMGNFVRSGDVEMEAPLQELPLELQVGKKWRAVGHQIRNGVPSDFYFDFHVARRETVTVPAGRFDTFLIEGLGWNRTFGSQLTSRLWVVPGLNFTVRRESIGRNNRGFLFRTDRQELVSAVQHGTDPRCAVKPAGVSQRNLVIRNGCI